MTRKSSRNPILIILIVETITSVRVPRNLNPNLNKIWNAISDNWWARQKIEEQDAWLESSKVAGRKKNSFLSSKWCLSAQFGTLERSPCLWLNQYFCEGQRVHWEYPMPSLAAHSFICSFLLCSTFRYFKYFCFYKINMEWEFRGVPCCPGCSRVFQELGVRFLSAANSPTENL